MTEIAIAVKNVSKKFKLFNSPKERLLEAFHPFDKKYHREFWALRGVNLEIPAGATVGIMGRNGSGKSTLLQVICSILRPTTGSVKVWGRVATLLELGAGFNPEFTGYENVLLNGTLMGFTEEEIRARLPAIETFADIGEFIDQPIKTYSSGMFVRLAFAAAINVDPDIMIIDEALAVGDAKFQYKCFSRLREFRDKGATVLFVSHDAGAIIKQCDWAILLENGSVLEMGKPKFVADRYHDLLFGRHNDHSHSHVPILVKEGYKGFNIVRYGRKYYACSHTIGAVDLSQLDEAKICEYVAEKKIIIGSSDSGVFSAIDHMTGPKNSTGEKPGEGNHENDNPLKIFLEETTARDNCINRKSYNYNENRAGDRRAEITDYLIVCKGQFDPIIIGSGDMIDIYVKILFHEDIDQPNYGVDIFNQDSLQVYGTNARLNNVDVFLAKKADIMVFKFSVKMNLHAGDHFITLAIGENKGQAGDKPADSRIGLIHLKVMENRCFDGVADLEGSLQEVFRASNKPG